MFFFASSGFVCLKRCDLNEVFSGNFYSVTPFLRFDYSIACVYILQNFVCVLSVSLLGSVTFQTESLSRSGRRILRPYR